jgi:riboflavin synthase
MFTGIIESIGEIAGMEMSGTNRTFTIQSVLAPELKVDQSVSHNGVCLTIIEVYDNRYQVTAIDETLQKTNLGHWEIGTKVNLERCTLANGRFDGHIVQGHVDQTAVCTAVLPQEGSWLYDFEYEAQTGNITVEKGSIAINGVSLTVFNSTENTFRVAIIPYTYEHTNFHQLAVGSSVNLEFDIIGKYLKKIATSHFR